MDFVSFIEQVLGLQNVKKNKHRKKKRCLKHGVVYGKNGEIEHSFICYT